MDVFIVSELQFTPNLIYRCSKCSKFQVLCVFLEKKLFHRSNILIITRKMSKIEINSIVIHTKLEILSTLARTPSYERAFRLQRMSTGGALII